jgi:hypothetical protein
MRVSGEFDVFYHELDQPDMMVFWNSSKRRKRMTPTSLMVKYHQVIGTDEWKLWHVYLMGNYNGWGIGVTLYQGHEGKWDAQTPDWVHPLVERAAPVRYLATTYDLATGHA